MNRKEFVEFIRYNWEDAEHYNGRFSPSHYQTKTLLDIIEEQQKEIERLKVVEQAYQAYMKAK